MSTGERSAARPLGVDPSQLGIWIFLGTVTMLFAAFSSAYIIRREAADWVPVRLPAILWWNTVILVLSSVTLESARSRAEHSQWRGALRRLALTTLLGLLFVAGQLEGWRSLVAQGVYIPTSPHSSFFYIFTGLHALHFFGALALLVVVTGRLEQRGGVGGAETRRLVALSATYWHFMGGLWIYLFLVLSWF